MEKEERNNIQDYLLKLVKEDNAKRQFKIVKEGISHKIDSLGRMVVPKVLRQKYGIDCGDEVQYYTIEFKGKTFIAIARMEDENSTVMDKEIAINALKRLGIDPPRELVNLYEPDYGN